MGKFTKPKLIIGLGNPGKAFENTYHNAGRMAVFYFAEKLGIGSGEWKSSPLFKYAKSGNLILAASETFMNESGVATKAALKFFKLQKENLLLAHDESDLTLGSFKISFGAGPAGHKGAESAQKALKTKDFWRARIGIRIQNEKSRAKAGDLVLKKIGVSQLKKLHLVFAELMEKLTENESPSGPDFTPSSGNFTF